MPNDLELDDLEQAEPIGAPLNGDVTAILVVDGEDLTAIEQEVEERLDGLAGALSDELSWSYALEVRRADGHWRAVARARLAPPEALGQRPADHVTVSRADLIVALENLPRGPLAGEELDAVDRLEAVAR